MAEMETNEKSLLDKVLGRKVMDQVDELTKKYKQPTSEDVTNMLGKRVTDEILGNTK